MSLETETQRWPDWNHGIVAGNTWNPLDSTNGFADGICKGVPVRCSQTGCTAYMKASIGDSSTGLAAAAREKIASDLAQILGAPVPPICLCRYLGTDEIGCLSMVVSSSREHWSVVRPLKGWGANAFFTQMINSSLRNAALMFAFDSWVGQIDHGDDIPKPQLNILLCYEDVEDGEGELIYIDYEKSLGVGGWSELKPAPFPTYLLNNINVEHLFEFGEQISAIQDDDISSVVERIPPLYLDPIEGASITRELIRRRDGLNTCLREWATQEEST